MRHSSPADEEFVEYARWLASRVELIVVDGSEPLVFADHARRLGVRVAHTAPDLDLRDYVNGKVAGVITGIRRAGHEHVVIADDDVRYDEEALARVVAALDEADVVRPQNYFAPVPWHACLDSARTLLNRISGGDWPGTLAVRRSRLVATNGYDGNVMFENLELVRTVKAVGGVESVPLDLYVRRLPPTTEHFWSQRVRQAYDEFARPRRLALWLGVLPAVAFAAIGGGWMGIGAIVAGSMMAAEAGRRRGGGGRVFPARASLCAPLWILERGICAWLAVGAHLLLGGIPYRGRIVSRAATPMRQLQARLSRA
jgi:Glycosyl transferase family 21